jgi:amino-acid N-acetyltransferase
MIRKAMVKDVVAVHKLLSRYAAQGLLLPRSLSELYDHLRDFFVIDPAGNQGIAAVCALGICWEDLAEIKSLAVDEGYRGKSYGMKLVERCLADAESLGLHSVFALTYIPDFFLKLGFKEVEKSTLPHKVWSDCLKCPKFPDCDEIAMILEF